MREQRDPVLAQSYLLIVEDDAEVVVTIERVARAPWPTRSAASFAAAVSTITAHPTIVGAIVDISLPDGSGLDLIPRIRASSPQCPVLVLTAYYEAPNVNAAHLLGAEFAAKPSFAANVRAFVGRLPARSGPGREQVVADFARVHRLTPKEQEVLELLVADHTREEVADRLGMTANTLRNHIHSLLAKAREPTVADLARTLRRVASDTR